MATELWSLAASPPDLSADRQASEGKAVVQTSVGALVTRKKLDRLN
jgi:hypothetical protein